MPGYRLAISHTRLTLRHRLTGGDDDGMPGRASDLIVIPGSFWERPQVTAALETRDVGRLFALVQQYAGASQTQIAIACGMTQGKVSDIMRGLEAIRSLARFERIANGLQLPDSARITMGLAPRSRSSAIPSRDARPASGVSPVPDLHSIDLGDGEEEEPVRRRTFVSLAGASMVSAILADMPPAHPADSAGQFAPILARYTADDAPSAGEKTPDVTRLTDAVTQARRDYQACRYSGLIKYLPALLAQLHTASMTLDGESRLRAYALAADAHHVAAGLLLKLDDGGLAYLAADRSMQAAQASGDPLTVGASARIITHTLMNGGHLDAAISTASTHAQLLDREISAHTPDSLSVYGSLLLRGAIAAAQHESRSTALDLLAEADDAGRRLGVDGNLRWTAPNSP